ncbi:MAG TPA: flagellar hook-associated protein FlgK [Phycisphaerae bacterium]|nr:flagellar hook-associated protein FlgK [Phycisphaerae bacterium]HPZ96629.1 flagellar hook-associated protein FlgK [Phycisphaerae bacterium]
MGLVTGALQIGRNALLAYQSALQVIGNNISNVGTEGYTRQTGVLTPLTGLDLPEGFTPGGGVALTGLRRNVDEAIENRYRIAVGDQAGALARQEVIGRIESAMNELSDSDLSTLLQLFFNALSDLQNEPTGYAGRATIITAGQSVADEIHRQRTEVLALRDQINGDMTIAVQRANEIASDIAELNVRISAMESTGRGASNALRDQRDRLLRELGELIQIQVREQPGGSINVYIGNEPLVQAGASRGLTTTLETYGEQPRAIVRFADNSAPVTIHGGKLGGLIEARDVLLVDQMNHLDGLARALVWEVNKAHASGQGIEGYTDITGAFDVRDPAAVLNSTYAGLSYKPQNGSFLITVTDKSTGLSRDHLITVDLDGIGPDDSLNSLVAQINAKITGSRAEVTGDNRLRFIADTGFEITFSQDSSNVLAALGVNVFFTGTSSQNIAVSNVLSGNPNFLAAASNRTPGDGSNAGRMAALGSEPVAALGGRSITEFYNAIVADVAVKGSAASASVTAAGAITSALSAQRESISGVSLDEETINLLRLERAFEGAARYTTTINRLIEEMLAIVA